MLKQLNQYLKRLNTIEKESDFIGIIGTIIVSILNIRNTFPKKQDSKK